MSLYLGVDLGTQSVKVVVFDAEMRKQVAHGQAALPEPSSPRPGAAEQEPSDWWKAFLHAMDQALATPRLPKEEIRALGVSGQQHGMVAMDAGGSVLRPAKLWCDVEASEEAATCSEMLRFPTPSGFTAPKVLWFLRREPELAARTARIALPHDWLNFRLTGNWATDHGDASGTGLYDPIAGSYRVEADLLHPDLPGWLLPLQDPDAEHGLLDPVLTARFGLSEAVRVSIGSGDNMMSALGAGATDPGTWVLSLGTSGTLFGPTEEALLDSSGAIAPFRSALGGGLPLICTQNCSTVVEEVRQQTGLDHARLTEAAQALQPRPEDPLFLPYLRGERTPDWPHASGVLFGLRPGDLSPPRLYRAAMEGASLALLHGLDRLRDWELPVQRLRLVGGGSRNPLWARMLCDAAGQPLEVVTATETAALGAALQACWMDTGVHPRDVLPETDSPVLQPNPEILEHYRQRLDRFLAVGEGLFGA